MRKIIKYGFEFLKHGFFRIVSALIPKDKNLWVFGCWQGKLYSDNSKYLFEWVNRNKPEITAVWFSREIDIVNDLRSNGYRAELIGTSSAYKTLMKASVVIETEGNGDIGGYQPGNCRCVQLWHGVAPKKMKFMKKYNKLETIIRNVVFENRKKQYWMLSSDQNKKEFQDFFGMSDKYAFVTGYPRNDQLIKNNSENPVIRMLNDRYPGCRKIIYMPTHRNFGNSDGQQFSADTMYQIDRFLHDNDMMLLFKPHIHELKKYKSIENDLKNIVFATDEKMYFDVYTYISEFDVLICDYSSVAYDYLCVNKPIVLFPYDIDEYQKTDGLIEQYKKIPLGPMCYEWNEVLKACSSVLENDLWSDNREQVRNVYHPYNDGGNCERVFEAIKSINK